MPHNRAQEWHCDLGIDPDADKTPDLRPGNNESPRTAIPGDSEPTLTKYQIGDSIMSRDPHPVDSAPRPCCGGIGGHSRGCSQPAGWREYTGSLPANVVRSFERAEHLAKTEAHLAFPGDDPAEVLRTVQANILDEVLDQHLFANVELPEGIEEADTWQEDDDGNWTRLVFGTRRDLGHLSVSITGEQRPDGSVTWELYVYADDDPTTPHRARALAEALVLAAAEYEVLTGSGPVVDDSRNW